MGSGRTDTGGQRQVRTRGQRSPSKVSSGQESWSSLPGTLSGASAASGVRRPSAAVTQTRALAFAASVLKLQAAKRGVTGLSSLLRLLKDRLPSPRGGLDTATSYILCVGCVVSGKTVSSVPAAPSWP